jgi:EpsI family protein
VLDALTAPLKELVSATVAHILGFAGYAVERSGVVLAVEGHELLVADACSGLNSIVSLAAMGLLYGHLRGASASRMAILALAVLPIAIVANVLRVLVLALVATHAGPDATQGWIHEVLGLAVFVVALLLLLAFDRLLKTEVRPRSDLEVRSRSDLGLTSVSRKPGSVPGPSLVFAFAVMAGAAVAAPVMKPVAVAEPIDLEAAVPAAFGGWRIDPEEPQVAPSPDVQANLARLYGQVVSRTYVNGQGERVMLTVAHGGDQSDALKAHRQEVCYRAQGFGVRGMERTQVQASTREIPATRFVATRGDRIEPVTYWFTMGDRVVIGRWERLGVQLSHGVRGRIPDGMLVRVSSLDSDPTHAYGAQAAFVGAMLNATKPNDATRLAGASTR